MTRPENPETAAQNPTVHIEYYMPESLFEAHCHVPDCNWKEMAASAEVMYQPAREHAIYHAKRNEKPVIPN